jgi:hypothetical protein
MDRAATLTITATVNASVGYANTATISAAEAFNRTNNGAKHRTRSQANVIIKPSTTLPM